MKLLIHLANTLEQGTSPVEYSNPKYASPVGEKSSKKGKKRQEEPAFPLPYGYYESVIPCRHIVFYLSDAIGHPNFYTDMVHRIRSATPNDIIYIHLNTPGGNLDTGVQIINAIRSTAAKVVTVLDGKAYSLGTLIFLAGHEFHVCDDCTMMFHNYSSGLYGKGNEQLAEVTAAAKWFSKLMRHICYPFLSKEEITSIEKGEDMWMDSDEVRKRLKNMIKILQAEHEKKPKRAAQAKKKTLPEADVDEVVEDDTETSTNDGFGDQELFDGVKFVKFTDTSTSSSGE